MKRGAADGIEMMQLACGVDSGIGNGLRDGMDPAVVIWRWMDGGGCSRGSEGW